MPIGRHYAVYCISLQKVASDAFTQQLVVPHLQQIVQILSNLIAN